MAALGPDHTDVGATLHNLSMAYKFMGRYAEAERLARQALAILRAKLGDMHPHVAAAWNTLAELRLRAGHYADAEVAYTRALEAMEGMLGTKHPYVGTILVNRNMLKGPVKP